MVGTASNRPVGIRKIEAHWAGLRPALSLDGFDIRDAEGRPALAFDDVETELGADEDDEDGSEDEAGAEGERTAFQSERGGYWYVDEVQGGERYTIAKHLSEDQARIPNSVFLPKPFSLTELTQTVQDQFQ